jgi:P-type Cu2+ transporter
MNDPDQHAGHGPLVERRPRAGPESPAGHEGQGGHDPGAGAGGHAGHDRHAGHSVEMFRTRFWVSLALTIPTVVWGHMLASAFGWHAPAFPGSTLVAPVLGTVVFLYGGGPFLRGAVPELRERRPGMMTLISLAIVVAFAFSVAVTLGW